MAVIQRTTPEHIAGIHHALDMVARERKYLVFLEAPPLEKSQEFILGNMCDGNPQFVALEEGSVVGWCDIVRKNMIVRKHCGLLGMGVLREFRGRGIGTQLIAETMAAAAISGITRIELTVYAHNESARKLYDKMGFQVEGLQKRSVLIDGNYIDSIMMAAHVQGAP
jgi:ribosomal protein S18 acetylase RimI-like enzyme